MFHSPGGANFSGVQDAHTAPNEGNFISSIIMLSQFNRGKRSWSIISAYKGNSYTFILLSSYLGLPKMICKKGRQSLSMQIFRP